MRTPSGPLLVGVEYSSDYEQTMSSLGFSGLSTGDTPALVNTIVKDVNAHGGLLGRKLSVVYHNTSTAASQSDPASAEQAVCTDFLQDHHVEFAVTSVAVLNDCFVHARVPAVQYGTISPEGADRAFLGPRSPYLYVPSSFETDDLYPLELDRLAALDYFHGWDPSTGASGSAPARIGLLASNSPSEHRQLVYLKSLLVKRHFTVASTFEYDTSSAAASEGGISSSVLRFSSAGVTHVIGLDGNVGLFMIQAEQQHYRPRYAMNTFLGPTSVQALVDPAAQLNGSLGVGWEPVNDVDGSHDDFHSVGKASCDDYLQKSGQNLDGQRSAQFVAYSVCDALQILLLGAQRGGSFSAAAMRGGLSTIGPRFPTALNLQGGYSETVSAGATAVRDLRYDNNCSCFVYVSKTLHN